MSTTYAHGTPLTVKALRSIKNGTRGYAVKRGETTTAVIEHVDYHGHMLEYVKLAATARGFDAVTTTLDAVEVLA